MGTGDEQWTSWNVMELRYIIGVLKRIVGLVDTEKIECATARRGLLEQLANVSVNKLRKEKERCQASLGFKRRTNQIY